MNDQESAAAQEHEIAHLADEAEHDADALEHRGEELASDIESTRAEWERKRREESVPGAPPPADAEPAHQKESEEVREGGRE